MTGRMGTNMSARRNISLIMAALTVLLCSACTELEEPDNGWKELAGDAPMFFSTSIAATKATTPYPANTSFGVFAFYQPNGTWNSSRKPNFMYNEEVVYNGSTYSYAPVRYWPSNDENKISFWAYSPYSANPDLLKVNTTTAYTSNTNNIPDIRFEVDGQTDLMASAIVKDKTYSNCTTPGVVSFTFNHLLSLIEFTVEKVDPNDDYTVTLTSISFENIYNTGIYKNSNSTWNIGNTTPRQSLPAFSGSQTVITTEASVWEDPSDPVTPVTVMPLPQTLVSTTARLCIEYTLSWDGGITPRTNTCYCPITEDWVKNKHYIYHITITPNMPIEFTISSVNWTDWGDANNYHLTS